MSNKSYDDIDYRARPKKFIERKMIEEACEKLIYFDKMQDYKYIGFGSLYFVDFKMFHKELGITDMISIEYETDPTIQNRFQFNKPYEFIKMEFQKSTQVLQQVHFDKRTIIWLDYDENLQDYMFEDVSNIIERIPSGSIFIVSLNCSINKYVKNTFYEKLEELKKEYKKLTALFVKKYGSNFIGENKKILSDINNILKNPSDKNQVRDVVNKIKDIVEEDKYNDIAIDSISRLKETIDYIFEILNNKQEMKEQEVRVENFKEKFTKYLIKEDITEKELVNSQSHIIIKQMFDRQIRKEIKLRNDISEKENNIIYTQLFNFVYKDGAPMMTFGGIVYNESENEKFLQANFEDLNYVRKGEDFFNIDIPLLTQKEKMCMDNKYGVDEISTYISDNAVDQYLELYRYMPAFFNVDIV